MEPIDLTKMDSSIVVAAIFALAICIALFAIFREIVLWYFKINESVKYLKRIADKIAPEIKEEKAKEKEEKQVSIFDENYK